MKKRQLRFKPYPDQAESWPERGRHVLLQYDVETLVFYDACRPAIAKESAASQQISRRSNNPEKPFWLKLGFLYTMARSNWGKTQGQEHTLAHWVSRQRLQDWLGVAVHVNYLSTVYESEAAWQQAKNEADILIDWSPDHRPNGDRTARRTLQIGLRRDALAELNADEHLYIEDITEYVREQANFMRSYNSDLLLIPYERVFKIKDMDIKQRLGLG